MTQIIFYLIIILLLFNYLYFLLLVLKGLKKIQADKEKNSSTPFVSIIIPFRNEEKNILISFESIRKQNYPKDKYEVIYVNDNSTDSSLTILLNKIKNEKIFKALTVPKDYSVNAHKKRALRYGIQNSSGEIILTTDADCIQHPNWIATMVAKLDEETAFVSGPVAFMNNENIFYRLQKLEFAGLVLVGAGLIGADKATICNAANLAYKKNVFDEVNGYSDSMNLSSGDDEFLMQKIRHLTKYKIKFCWDEQALVMTEANETLNNLYQQRKRWASKGMFYKDMLLILKLIFIYLFYLTFPANIILGIFLSPLFFLLFSVQLILKFIYEYAVMKNGIPLLLDNIKFKDYFIAQIFHVPYIIIAGFSGAFGNYVWKDRKIKR
ncbi:MAG: hypothetical protein C0425_01145 [Chlorobiaceae bacterium]|nr:hypothetical protein [Chlorobiaceae bacterium]MBA4308927.1 hypothetical protein [Chlorobiaceae bacterium]